MEEKKGGLNVSVKSFLTAIIVILVLMVLTYALTFIIPAGEYARITDASGNTVIDPEGGFSFKEASLPFWKWLLSPLLVLTAEGSGMIIAIIAFLLVVGGVFTALDECGLMKYMLHRIVNKFSNAKYKLLCVISFFFMAMGAFVGSFEECVPLVPIVVALSVSLGWNKETGLGMSLLAVGCGFASGVCNPFTIGVAQSLAGLPMFSGIWLRILSFVLIYVLLVFFLIRNVKKLEREGQCTAKTETFEKNTKMDKGLISFASILGAGIIFVLLSGFIKELQDLTMIIVAVMFLAAGIVSASLSGMEAKKLLKAFLKGIISILPAVFLILMASSIKYILTEGFILDTLLYYAVNAVSGLPKWCIVLFVYLVVLVMNFFISSGSAKAFLLIPLIIPMAQLFGISSQLCVVAFAFGDGFSNVFYPTNAALLIALGLADISYVKWVRYSYKFQLLNLLLTSLILLFGFFIGYC